jgi:hypothetical protein
MSMAMPETAAGGGTPAPTAPTWVTPREGLVLFAHRVTVRTAAKVALLVGTVLSLVNQGSAIAAGDATVATWVRVGVNYLVPFLVSSYGFLAARRRPAAS